MVVSVKNFSSQVRLGDSQTSGSLTIYPLYPAAAAEDSAAKPEPYMLLAEALGRSGFEIGEVSESGSVNTVLITNMTGQPVLILDGEEISGAKQNRMVNATILVASGVETAVPVSCVEQGRWRYDSDTFERSETIGYSTLRRQKAEQVQHSLRHDQSFAADQGAIWNEIKHCEESLNLASPTAALRDTYRSRDQDLSTMIKNFEHQPGQIGIAVYINNRFACLDLFAGSATLTKLWPRLLKSYALEALTTRGRAQKEPQPAPAALISAIDQSEYVTYPSVSLGLDLRLNGPGIVGAGLLVDEQIVHLSVFPREENDTATVDINTPRRRRRSMGGDQIIY